MRLNHAGDLIIHVEARRKQCKIIQVGMEESNVFQEHMPRCLPRELLPPSHLYIFVFVPEWLSGLLQATYVAEKSLYRRDCHIVPV